LSTGILGWFAAL